MAIDLSSVVGGVRLKPPKIVLYGVGGIGKTTFASHAPDPVFIFTEEGQGKKGVKRFEPRPDDPVFRTWGEIMEAVGVLYSGDHKYKTVVLDTLDFAEPLLWAHTSARHGQQNIESFGYGKGYVHACDEARVLLQGLDALRNERGMAIILLAHSETKKYDAPDHEPYDRYKLRLHDRLGNLVHDWCDVMLFANWKVHVVKDKQSFNKETARGTGRGERLMWSEERPAWWAKNRYDLPFEMPLSWQAFQDALAIEEPKPETKKAAKAATKS